VSQEAGWYRDPFHRGQERYWDGRMWTQGTRAEGEGNHGAATTEGAVVPTSTSTSTSSGVSAADQADARLAAAFAGAASAPPSDVAAEPSFAPLGGPMQPAAGGEGPHHAPRGRRGRNIVLGVAAAALVLVAGGVSTAVLLGGSGNASAQEAVANAATQTTAQSADMSMSIGVGILGVHENVTASGAFDFAQKLGTMTMTIPVNGQQYTSQEIVDGSTVYVNVGGLGGGLAPSKPWVAIPASQLNSSSNGLGTLDPTAMLHQLESAGGTVSSLGPTTYDGTSVTEYAATLPASALMGDIGKLPASLQQGVSGLHLPDMHMDIYVTQDNLLKALSVPSYSVSVGGQTLSMDMTMVLSNYGVPVNVTPPPADQVEPLSQLGGGLGGLGNSGSTGNSGSSI
jgi:Protein of unknown function (DUF2510)